MATKKKAARAAPAPSTEELVEDIEQTPRPALSSAAVNARAARSDDWVEVRCIVGNVHTSVGKMLSGQVEHLPPEEAAILDDLDRVKIL